MQPFFRGAIFDADGTLLDSMPIWGHVTLDYLALNGKTPRDGLFDDLQSLGGHQLGRYLAARYDLDKTPQEVSAGINALLEDFYFNTAPAKPGVRRMLDGLRARDVRMCVATATDRRLIEAALKRNGLYEYFGCIFTCAEVGIGKSEPDIFLRAADFLGAAVSKVCVFEDALYAVKTAKQAGFPVVAVYDDDARAHAGEIRALADVYLNSFEEWVF